MSVGGIVGNLEMAKENATARDQADASALEADVWASKAQRADQHSHADLLPGNLEEKARAATAEEKENAAGKDKPSALTKALTLASI